MYCGIFVLVLSVSKAPLLCLHVYIRIYFQNGLSPVIVASLNGHLEILKLLEKHNGDVFHTDSDKVRQ